MAPSTGEGSSAAVAPEAGGAGDGPGEGGEAAATAFDGEGLDSPAFDPLEYINRIFPDAASLANLDEFLEQLRYKIRKTDQEILAAVRQQSTSGDRAKQDLRAAKGSIYDLFSRINEIREKAEQSEVMVQEICRDIKKLDYAKRHLTTSITTLRRLSMLISATQNLQLAAEERRYADAANLLDAVNQLSAFFEPYLEIPKVSELKGQLTAVRALLRVAILDEFNAVHFDEEEAALPEATLRRLEDACRGVDALDPSVKDDLVNRISNKEMGAYQTIFSSTGDTAQLDRVDRRYLWMKKQLKNKEAFWEVFPKHWRVQQLMCITFCKITRAQLAEALDAQRDQAEVAVLIQALHRTKDFEVELAELFGGQLDALTLEAQVQGTYDEDPTSAAAVRRKYEQAKREREREAAGEDAARDEAALAAARTTFIGSISSCFEPHLKSYVELEEKSLLESVDDEVRQESWAVEGEEGSAVLGSSAQVFLHIKKSLKRCSSLTKGETLLQLTQAFTRVLCKYAQKLLARLPSTASASSPLATGLNTTDWHVKMDGDEERVACLIINTAEYCYETVEGLAESCVKLTDEPFKERIDMTAVEDEFSSVTTTALSKLVLALETKIDGALGQMARVTWGDLEVVGDQSKYVNDLSGAIADSIPRLGGLLSQNNFRFFADKFAASFVPRFYAAILKVRRLSDTGAQQLLLDTQAVRTALLDLPSLSGHALPPSFSKSVTQEMTKAECLLKVLLSPTEALVGTFLALMPNDAGADFLKILEMKAVPRAEQQELVDQFNGLNMSGTTVQLKPQRGPDFSQTFRAMQEKSKQSMAAMSAGGGERLGGAAGERAGPRAAPGAPAPQTSSGRPVAPAAAKGPQFGQFGERFKFGRGAGGGTGAGGNVFNNMFGREKKDDSTGKTGGGAFAKMFKGGKRGDDGGGK